MIAPLLANLISTVVHCAIVFPLVLKYDMHIKAVGIATSVHFMVRYVVSILIVRFTDVLNEHQVKWSDPEIYQSFKPQLYLSLQCALMTSLPWWAQDTFTLIASYIDENTLAA